MRHASLHVFGWALGVGLALAGCGGPASPDGGNAGTATSGGSGGAGQGAGGSASAGGSGGEAGGLAVGCSPPCEAPQLCSAAGSCIDHGTCLVEEDCATGMTCGDGQTCVPGGGCGAQEISAEPVPPNMLVVLDRSCSMKDKVAGVTKWAIAAGALSKLTTDQGGKIRFGLGLFPDIEKPSCAQGAISIPVAPGTEKAIQDLLQASLDPKDPYYPDGPCVTNIDTAMQQAATEPALADPDRDSYVLLITDGKQAGCDLAGGDKGTLQIIADLHGKQVPTFVVGFGAGVDPKQLSAFAEAGGVPASDPNAPEVKFYKAEDQASLDGAFAAIAKKTLGCTFSLENPPPDAQEIFVFFDDTESVPQDATHADGWDYDPATNQVTFYGPACEKLKSGEVTDVDIVFGCDEPTPN